MSNPPIHERLIELMALPVGWDGYRGIPVKALNTVIAGLIIEALKDFGDPAAVPGSDGSVQLEWHQDGYDIEIDICYQKSISADDREAVEMKPSKPKPVRMGKDLALPPLSIEGITVEARKDKRDEQT